MIAPIKLAQLPQVLELTTACRKHMESNNIFQWTKEYPSIIEFTKDVKNNELFGLFSKDDLLGCVVVSEYMDAEYKTVRWHSPDAQAYYIHRLAVAPKFQGKGYARCLMDYAEQKARENEKDAVRLDTFSKNPRNQRFYEQRGYQRLEKIHFPNQSPHPFYCYELVL